MISGCLFPSIRILYVALNPGFFCKIIAGEIPSSTIYEDEKFKVILDVGPATKDPDPGYFHSNNYLLLR